MNINMNIPTIWEYHKYWRYYHIVQNNHILAQPANTILGILKQFAPWNILRNLQKDVLNGPPTLSI